MNDQIQNARFDLTASPLRRHVGLALFAYFPPFANTLYGFPGIKSLLWIGLTHLMPIAVYKQAIRHEAQVHRLFAFLRKRGLC